ncbi:MAG: APC family permease [Polyangia bacterium]|jgi:amino acid transporter
MSKMQSQIPAAVEAEPASDEISTLALLEKPSYFERIWNVLQGRPKSFRDPNIFHNISLIAFLAWVGLGADGLSSSAYGPDECFRALQERGNYTFLAVFLALATAVTVMLLSVSYSKIIEHFPSGGGGYVVATKLLGRHAGVVSGSALLVDYVLTISVSIASGADAIFNLLPLAMHRFKLIVEIISILALVLLNIRGVKESVTTLLPIFLVFLLTHAILLVGGIASHFTQFGAIAGSVSTGLHQSVSSLGVWGLFMVFTAAFARGSGTYTGIEAVSNGLQIMREPKVHTGKKTMVYMALSLAITSAGILLCYLLFKVQPSEGKTLNGVLVDAFAGNWRPFGLPAGRIFVLLVLVSEGALLFVAAQTGFIDGPRVMANMAVDSWLPRRFASLSDRLTTANGVVILGSAALALLIATHGNLDTLVVMYAINVFVTFSLSQLGMARFWWQRSNLAAHWRRQLSLHVVALIVCVAILAFTIVQKFSQGAWVTLVVTAVIICLCICIEAHYRHVAQQLRRLDQDLGDLGQLDEPIGAEPDPRLPTAVLMVGSYGGIGIHSLLSIQRSYAGYFKNVVFVSVAVVDSGTFKGADQIALLQKETQESLDRYVKLARGLGWNASSRTAAGLDPVREATAICAALAEEFPRSTFFAGKLIWKRETWWQRILHNETAYQIERRLHWKGLAMAVLPIRVGVGADARADPVQAHGRPGPS